MAVIVAVVVRGLRVVVACVAVVVRGRRRLPGRAARSPRTARGSRPPERTTSRPEARLSHG